MRLGLVLASCEGEPREHVAARALEEDALPAGHGADAPRMAPGKSAE